MGLRQCPGAVGAREVRGCDRRGHRVGEVAIGVDHQVGEQGLAVAVVAVHRRPGHAEGGRDGVQGQRRGAARSDLVERERLDALPDALRGRAPDGWASHRASRLTWRSCRARVERLELVTYCQEEQMATADVLVTGATGNTGRPLVEELLTRDAVVRVMVRSADAQVPGDQEKVVADVDDPGSLRSALEGVRRAYLVTPSSERAERQQLLDPQSGRLGSPVTRCLKAKASLTEGPFASCCVAIKRRVGLSNFSMCKNKAAEPGRSGVGARAVAAVAIALFWCISAAGTTVGVSTLATAINAATSTPAEARQRWRRGCRGRRPWRGRRWRGRPERFGIWFGGC